MFGFFFRKTVEAPVVVVPSSDWMSDAERAYHESNALGR
jgi:hypothetical protein